MKLVVALVVLLAACCCVRADLPIHCLAETTYGQWEVSIGPQGFDKDIQCKSFTPVRTMVVNFQKPNIITNDQGEKGLWSMMDDEGVEFFIGGLDYYTWWHYDPQPYNCTYTSNGWYHRTPAGKTDWGCWSMSQKKAAVSEQTVQPAKKKLVKMNTPVFDLKTAKQVCDYVNTVQNAWECDVASAARFIGRSARELQIMAGKPKQATVVHHQQVKIPDGLPETWDWRNVQGVNYVSPVRDQAFCGSCYAFATTGALEARIRVASKMVYQPILSPQDVVSCDKKYSQGCSGGFDYVVGKYFEDFGIVEDGCFPYTASDTTPCSDKCQAPAKIWYGKDHRYIGNYNGNCSVAAMMQEIYDNGPISVSVMWSGDLFLYRSGVYAPVEGGIIDQLNWEKTNHLVVIVGWGKESSSSKPYWIVKNSWGEEWGDHGYFNVEIGIDKMAIESEATKLTPII